jgi:DNA-binding IclR family transcriptional regulator
MSGVTVQSVERAAVLLQLIAARGEPIGATDVAAALGVAKSSAHQLLRTLHDVGFLDQDDAGRYSLGDGARRLAQGPLDTNLLRSIATNWVDALAARTGESAYIGVLRGQQVLVVHHVFRPDDSPQRLAVGDVHEAHASAMGQVLLALAPNGQAVSRTLAPASLTHRTLDADALGTRLRLVRHQHWACTPGEHRPDIAGLAAPLRGRGGLVVAAVGVIGPVERVTVGHGAPRPALLAHVRATAAAISDDLTSTL